MKSLNENKVIMQFTAGIINEDRFDELMKQIKADQKEYDDYEKNKQEMYGLDETKIFKVKKGFLNESRNKYLKMQELIHQIKSDAEDLEQYEKEKDEIYSLKENKYIKLIKENLQDSFEQDNDSSNEQYSKESFIDFLRTEFGDTPTVEETAEAIVNWALNYMLGENEADFEGVSYYMNDEIWDIIKDEISENYMSELRKFVKNSQGDLEENIGIKTKEDIKPLNENEDILKKKLDDVFAEIIKDLPNILKTTDSNKDGKLDLTAEPTLNEQYLKEVLGLGLVAANTLMSAPGLIGLAGKFMKSAGSIPGVNINSLKTTGELISQLGSDWQSKYISIIETTLKKLMPNSDDETINKASRAVLITIMSTLALSGGVIANSGAHSVKSVVNIGKDLGKDLGMDLLIKLSEFDTKYWKSKLASLLPYTLGKIFN